MRTSTFALSKSQQIVFAIVLTLGILFGGCSDSSAPTSIGIPVDDSPLAGSWTVLAPQDGTTHTLDFYNGIASYTVTDATGECGSYPRLSKVFSYDVTGPNTLESKIVHHAACGQALEQGDETIYFSLYDGNLRIFNRNFVRN